MCSFGDTTMILLFSHKLNEAQIESANVEYGIENFIALPKELQKSWSNIPPEMKNISEILEAFKKFLLQNSKKGDYVLVQGDFGAVYSMVKFSLENGFIPLYATTTRVVQEYEKDGKMVKKSVFNFRRFREYE